MPNRPPVWRKNPLASGPGASLGPLIDIEDGTVKEFRFGEGQRVFSIIVARRGNVA